MTITELKEIARKLIEAEQQVEACEAELKAAEAHRRHIAETVLPDAFRAAEVTELKLEDGRRFKLDEFAAGVISETNRTACLEWLRANNHGSIIKTKIEANVDGEVANRVCQELIELGYAADLKETVHPSTLKAFIKEEVSNPDFPKELFGVRLVSRVVVK